MSKIWIITKKELRGTFSSLQAYILIVIFLGFSGFFTWFFGRNIFFSGQANLQPFFGLFRVAYLLLTIFVPAITMKQIAEEKKTGTIELLLTKPISDWQVVTGKFLSSLILIVIMLLLTIPYYFSLMKIGDVDHSSVFLGYLGLLILSAAYISIGIFASSITNNQIISFLLTIVIILVFHVTWLLSMSLKGGLGKILSYLSIPTHYESITRGVLDSQNILFFLSIIFIGLISTEYILSKRNHIE